MFVSFWYSSMTKKIVVSPSSAYVMMKSPTVESSIWTIRWFFFCGCHVISVIFLWFFMSSFTAISNVSRVRSVFWGLNVIFFSWWGGNLEWSIRNLIVPNGLFLSRILLENDFPSFSSLWLLKCKGRGWKLKPLFSSWNRFMLNFGLLRFITGLYRSFLKL